MRMLKAAGAAVILYSCFLGSVLTSQLHAQVLIEQEVVMEPELGPVTAIEGLVRVQDIDPTIIADLRYATENNFTGKKIYPVAVLALRKETALKLATANAEFKEKGYTLKVWDGYRPPYVQKIFWEIMPDARYVADPNKGGSKHNRGGAVDVTLVDLQGNEVEMPSAYDDFSEKAWRKSPLSSVEARQNEDYLTSVMAKHGFSPYEHEWWHFDDPDYKNFPLVDVKLEQFLPGYPDIAPGAGSPEAGAVILPEELSNLSEGVDQALIVTPNTEGGFQGKLTAWERKVDQWESVKQFEYPIVLGKNGLAPDGEKQEGDGRTPSGTYPLGTAFGYGPDLESGLHYRQVTDNDLWIDDPESAQYNQLVRGPTDAKSFERMKRDDDLYEYGVVIQYNTDPVVPGKGSAIFMHLWRGPDSPTAGCVAMAKENFLPLLKWLNWDHNPVIIFKKGTTPF